MNYQEICSQVQQIARSSGEFIRNEHQKIGQKDIKVKSTANFVTYVDKTSEEKIVEALSKLLPGCGFITEEGSASHSNEKYKWIVDPLDGTTNYIHGISPFSVSIALTEEDKPILGVVYEISMDEMFYAWKGSPAYLNEKKIEVSNAAKHEDSLIATGFPYYDFNRINDYIETLRFLMKNTQGLRRMGSAAADLAYLAAGRFDAFFEHALHAWDVAAGAIILKQAGGIITDFNGGDNWLFGKELIAANSNYFNEFYKVVHKNLGKKS